MRSLSFLDGMPNTALTSCLNPDEPYRLFHFTIRAGIFRENVSEWTTKKERTCYDASGSPLSVWVDAGKGDSIAYVLLHEATHIVDGVLRITPDYLSRDQASGEVMPTEFTKGIWSKLTLPAPRYRDPLIKGPCLTPAARSCLSQRRRLSTPPCAGPRSRRRCMPATPGATISPSSSRSITGPRCSSSLTGSRYERRAKRSCEYEPMKSELVRSRFNLMKQFYE